MVENRPSFIGSSGAGLGASLQPAGDFDVDDNVLDFAPFNVLFTGTVTFEGTAGDYWGAGDLAPSWINGYEISFDGGASWQVIKSWDNGGVPRGNFRHRWRVEGGLDATTIPVRIRTTDNVGNARTQVVTITLDTGPPHGLDPIVFSDEFGYHFDLRTDITATWHTPVDGSGTVYPKVLGGTSEGVPAHDAHGLDWHVFGGEIGTYYASIGAEDAAGNISYENFGVWYGSAIGHVEGWWGNTNQTIAETIDGVFDIEHDEWLMATLSFAPDADDELCRYTGSGSVVSDPPGVDCSASCSQTFAYTTLVTLTATADSGSSFGGWSGGVVGTSNPVSITMTRDVSVTASFELGGYDVYLPLVVRNL